MMQDMQGIEEYEQQVDYFEELKKVESKVASQGASGAAAHQKKPKTLTQDIEDGLEDEYLMQNIIWAPSQTATSHSQDNDSKLGGETNPYSEEYQDVINQMSRLCSVIALNNRTEVKDKKVKIEEQELLELCPRVWSLVTEYDKQT